jgi:hypothetical protein
MTTERTMLEIKNTLVSLDVIEEKFVCDLSQCKGACCVVGESGAPLTNQEKNLVEEAYPVIRQYMTPVGIEAVEAQGWYVYDIEGDCVTPLVNQKECAYAFRDEQGITLCAFEKAFYERKIDFLKPLSCHLYPIRVTKYKEYDAVNYESNSICSAACRKGNDTGTILYQFLQKPLVRAYGQDWYDELTLTAQVYCEQNLKNE